MSGEQLAAVVDLDDRRRVRNWGEYDPIEGVDPLVRSDEHDGWRPSRCECGRVTWGPVETIEHFHRCKGRAIS